MCCLASPPPPQPAAYLASEVHTDLERGVRTRNAGMVVLCSKMHGSLTMLEGGMRKEKLLDGLNQ